MSKRHINLALFVAHDGCPRRCVFCNQHSITGCSGRLSAADIDAAVEASGLSRSDKKSEREIAFFGGSFTAIDFDYMIELLEAAHRHIESGLFGGIRISTRPNALDDEICKILKNYGVKTVELGAQSMDDDVLLKNKREHSALDVIRAARLIHKHSLSLGLQMMIGLYGATESEPFETAKKLASLDPTCVRIYPTLVLKDTELENLYLKGDYEPLSLPRALNTCSKLLEYFEAKGIEVIRVGLHSSTLEKDYLAGPHHPAFGELCKSMIYLRKARSAIVASNQKGPKFKLSVNKNRLSQMIGQGGQNIKALKAEGYDCRVVGLEDLDKYEILVSSDS